MATQRPSKEGAIRALEVLFQPWPSGHTTVNVLVVDYRGSRRVSRRIGSCDLRVGPLDLVGLTPQFCTWVLVDAFHAWLLAERPSLTESTDGPSPPEAVRRPLGGPQGVLPDQLTLPLG